MAEEKIKYPLHIVSVYFDAEQKKDLEEISKKLGLSLAAFCRTKVLKAIKEENFILNKAISKGIF